MLNFEFSFRINPTLLFMLHQFHAKPIAFMENTDKIKSLLENKVCLIHDEHPVINDSEEIISLTCCCDAFEVECYKAILFTFNSDYNTAVKM